MFRVTGSAKSGGEDLTRRSFVEAGVLELGGLSLADLMSLRAGAANSATTSDRSGDTSVMMSGGKFRMGQAVGMSDARGAYVSDRPLHPEDVAATVYHHLGIDARNTAIPDRAGRPRYLVEHGEPIRELL